MARSKRGGSKAGVVEVDFSGVKDGGGGVRVPEDDYHMKIASVKQDISEKSGNAMLVFQFAFVDKKFAKKGTVRDNIVLGEKSLWRLRDLLEAVGVSVPKKTVQLPIKKLVGKELGITLVDGEPYRGRIKSEVGDYLSLEDFQSGGVDDDDEDDIDDDDDDAGDEDFDEMDRSELKAYIKENELDVSVKKSMSDDDIREAIQAAEGDDDDDDDDEDDEDIDDLDLDEL